MMDKRNNTSAFSKRFVMSKILRLGAWRDELRVLESMTSMAGTNVSNRARLFSKYFSSEAGSVSWQSSRVTNSTYSIYEFHLYYYYYYYITQHLILIVHQYIIFFVCSAINFVTDLFETPI